MVVRSAVYDLEIRYPPLHPTAFIPLHICRPLGRAAPFRASAACLFCIFAPASYFPLHGFEIAFEYHPDSLLFCYERTFVLY